jgi:antitoxin component YwqK of YwqJK toxin-antitoxin module
MVFPPRTIGFLFGAFLFLACGSLAAQAEYYASNESGMAFEEIPAFRNRDFDFSLEIRRNESGQTRTVWKRDGTEFRRWEYELKESGRVTRIRLFEYGSLKQDERYRQDGRIEKFEEYGPKGLETVTDYEYSGKRLVKATTASAAGALLYADSYKYAMNGSLREVKRVNADGKSQSAGQDFSGGRIIDKWYSLDSKATIDRYSASGELTDNEKWESEKLLRSDSSSLRDNGKDKNRQILTDAERGIEIERLFDDKGRISIETTRKNAKLESRTEYAYDGSGKLAVKKFSRSGKINIVKYAYNADGSKASEEESENGEMVRRVIYDPEGNYWEEILHDGQVTVRVRWANGWKREEEILRDGKVIRRRDFK